MAVVDKLMSFSCQCVGCYLLAPYIRVGGVQNMSILRLQDLQKLSEEQSRISSLISEKQELEEKLASSSRKASGTEIAMPIPSEA